LDKNALMSLVKEALGVDQVLCAYFDSLAPLRGVFEKYSMSDGVVETMTVSVHLSQYSSPFRKKMSRKINDDGVDDTN